MVLHDIKSPTSSQKAMIDESHVNQENIKHICENIRQLDQRLDSSLSKLDVLMVDFDETRILDKIISN